MHGVKKETLPDEEKAAKKLEQQKKLKSFLKGRDFVLKKHKKGEFDFDGLQASGKLLGANPDVSTFWNYRRRAFEYFMSLEKKKEALQEESNPFENGNEKCELSDGGKVEEKTERRRSSESNPGAKAEDVEVEKLFKAELDLTYTCILKNPKSYGSWHQRGWVLSRMKEPDFAYEIKTCNKALEMDERNFHCWDHRRLVCKLAGLSEEEELAFADEKVTKNFSNYSAWHYRSSLLKRIHSDPEGNLPLKEEQIEKELELASNAFYTDPDDTSAWFYTTWLFQQNVKTNEGVEPTLIGADFSAEEPRLTLLFDPPICAPGLQCVMIFCNNAMADYFPQPIRDGDVLPTFGSSSLWDLSINPDAAGPGKVVRDVDLLVMGEAMKDMDPDEEPETIKIKRGDNLLMKERLKNMIRGPHPTGALKKALETQLGHCRNLMEMESENKWALLTATQCMQRLGTCDSVEKAGTDEVSENFKKLETLDPKRKCFYSDLRSRHIMEKKLIQWLNMSRKEQENVNLANYGLTTFYFTRILGLGLLDLDISNNGITSLVPLKFCRHLKRLNAQGNNLTNLNGLQDLVHCLEELFIPENQIESAKDGICPYLEDTERLEKILVAGNPFRNSQAESQHLLKFFNDGVRVIMDWL